MHKLIQDEKFNYEIAVIENKLMVSDDTRKKHFWQLQHLTGPVKKWIDFEKVSTNADLPIQKETVAPSDDSIGAHANARMVVRWLYNEGAVGKVSHAFDLGNAYLLAVMVDKVKVRDLFPLDSVYRKGY